MSKSRLPQRASLEFPRKLAKDHLHSLQKRDPAATLATARLAVAREHGYRSWRELKPVVDARDKSDATLFVKACAAGDIETVRAMLTINAALAYATDSVARLRVFKPSLFPAAAPGTCAS
jgi:hypothetical protein